MSTSDEYETAVGNHCLTKVSQIIDVIAKWRNACPVYTLIVLTVNVNEKDSMYVNFNVNVLHCRVSACKAFTVAPSVHVHV